MNSNFLQRYEKMPLVVSLGWILVVSALFLAGIFVTSTGSPRFSLLIPFLVVGSLLCEIGNQTTRSGKEWWFRFLLMIVAMYFMLRAFVSPVWDLARMDMLLVGGGILTFAAASVAMRFRLGRALFLGVLVTLALVHAAIAGYQTFVDEGYAFFYGVRADVKGVSGAYYHRNYLAGFLSLAAPVILLSMLALEGGFRSKFLKVGAFAIFVGLVFLAFLTNSRGGFSALIIAVTCGVFYFAKPAQISTKKKVLKAVGAGVVILLFLVGSWFLLQTILEQREAVDGSLGGRFYLSGIAFEIWQENPLFGAGSRSYSYLFPKYFYGLGGGTGNAQFVHSDYIQSLSDYGVVGLVGVVALIFTFGWVFLRARRSTIQRSWLVTAAFGVLVGEVLRAVFDFNLHIMANMLFFAALLGGAVGVIFEIKDEVAQEKQDGGRSLLRSRVGSLLLLVPVAGFSLWAGRLEILAAREWIAVEVARGKGENELVEIRRFAEKAPSFEVLRAVARNTSASLLSEKATPDRLRLAHEDWKKTWEAHPLDGEALTNYARTFDDLGEFEEAERFHLQALEAVGKRENKYGVLFGLGQHFIKRGEEARRERKAGQALFLFKEADLIVTESWRRYFGRRREIRVTRKWLRSRIEFLEGARIEPEPVSFSDWRARLP